MSRYQIVDKGIATQAWQVLLEMIAVGPNRRAETRIAYLPIRMTHFEWFSPVRPSEPHSAHCKVYQDEKVTRSKNSNRNEILEASSAAAPRPQSDNVG